VPATAKTHVQRVNNEKRIKNLHQDPFCSIEAFGEAKHTKLQPPPTEEKEPQTNSIFAQTKKKIKKSRPKACKNFCRTH
jgi:hypothetical protein